MTSPEPLPSEVIYQVKALVRGSKPLIWRRIQTPDVSLARLHYCLQAVTGWSDAFKHAFLIRGHYYMDMEQSRSTVFVRSIPLTRRYIRRAMTPGEAARPLRDEQTISLSGLGLQAREWFLYEYGPWRLRIIFEKTRPPEPNMSYPVCVKGRQAGPPEQLNGLKARHSLAAMLSAREHERREGYDEFLSAMRDHRHPDHKMWREWWGGKFDPEAFDLDEINQALRRVK